MEKRIITKNGVSVRADYAAKFKSAEDFVSKSNISADKKTLEDIYEEAARHKIKEGKQKKQA